MTEYLRVMSAITRDLQSTGINLNDENRLTILSLHDSWEALDLPLMHNENIEIFDDISRHLELYMEPTRRTVK